MNVSEYPLTSGRYLIEASAGTGKTYTITHLVLRLILERVPVREILVTTFSKAAAAELKARILKLLNDTLDELRPDEGKNGTDPEPDGPSPEPIGEAERASRMLLLMRAVSSIDEMTVSTIHGFCQRMLREFVLETRLDFEQELIPDESPYVERLVRAFCRERFYGGDADGNPNFDRFYQIVMLYIGKEVDECPEVPGGCPERDAYLYVRERIRAEKTRDGAVSFDDLIRIFSDALDANPGLAKLIRSRYRAVFVDEFQDTDRTQYGIFDRCFPADGPTLFYMIGDPKQAIYGFRGADIYTYLQAKRSAKEPFSLTENFRSSPGMIRAVNLMFGDGDLEPGHESRAVFMQEGIPFISVVSGRKAEDFPGDTGANLRLSRYEGRKDACENAIMRDVVRDIRRLLSTGCGMTVLEETEKDGRKERVSRPLRASDIAILVQKHAQASGFVRLLNREGVAASACKSGRIYDTDEAKVMLLLLKSFLEPDMQTARGVMLSPFFRCTCAEIVSEPARSEAVMKRLADCGAVWRESGLPAAFLGFMDAPCEDGVTPRVRILSESNGERALTNYLQIMELLYQRETEDRLRPEEVLNALNLAVGGFGGVRGAAGTDDAEENPDQLRLDRDSASVQILTMFTAKGLEFPVVFVPFPAKTDVNHSLYGMAAYKVNAAASGGTDTRITLDFGMDPGNKRIVQEESLRSDVRLLYVALTRATLATYLYVQQLPEPKKGGRGSPVNFVRSAQGVLLRDKHLSDDTAEALAAWKDYFIDTRDVRPDVCAEWYRSLSGKNDPADCAAGGDGTGTRDAPVFELLRDRAQSAAAQDGDDAPLRPDRDAEGAMEALALPAVSDDWRVMSFSAFHTLLTDSAFRETESPADHDAEAVSGDDDAEEFDGRAPSSAANAFRDFPHGRRAGTLTHGVLERFATAGPPAGAVAGPGVSCYFNLFADGNEADRHLVMPVLEDALGKQAFRPECLKSLYDGVSYALRTPLPGIGIPLCGIRRDRMTAELEFFLDAPSSLDIRRILSIMRSDASEQAASCLPDCRQASFDKKGVLNGIVDLIFEHDGKYYIVDWKTNWLGRSDADYAPDRIAAAMGGSGYILQSYLYAAGLLRLLRQRGIGDDAFGGVYYLFLRGLDGHSANGIWRDVPPLTCLENLLTLFQGDKRV